MGSPAAGRAATSINRARSTAWRRRFHRLRTGQVFAPALGRGPVRPNLSLWACLPRCSKPARINAAFGMSANVRSAISMSRVVRGSSVKICTATPPISAYGTRSLSSSAVTARSAPSFVSPAGKPMVSPQMAPTSSRAAAVMSVFPSTRSPSTRANRSSATSANWPGAGRRIRDHGPRAFRPAFSSRRGAEVVRPRPAICPSPTGPPGAGGGRFLEMAGRLDVVLTYWPLRPSKRVVADRQTSAIRLPRGDGGSPFPPS